MNNLNNDKLVFGVLGAAAVGLAVKAVKVIIDRKRDAEEHEEIISLDLEDLDR